MLAREGQSPIQLLHPARDSLAGPRIDQIETEARKMPARDIEGREPLACAMGPAEEFERAIVERLDAERDAVDAGVRQCGEIRRLHRGRIGFQRDFEIGGIRPVMGDAFDQGRDSGRRHERGRAAAEEDAVEPPPGCRLRIVIELRQQCTAPALLVDALAHMAVEVAIGAFGAAERPVDIEAEAAVVLLAPGNSGEARLDQLAEGLGAMADLMLALGIHLAKGLAAPIGQEHGVIAEAALAPRRPDEAAR